MVVWAAAALPRSWPLAAAALLALLSAVVAGYLGWVHLALLHGAGSFESLCNLGSGFDCDAVNTSRWSELAGLPISFWALPLYLCMVLLAWRGLSDSRRGARARGALVLIAVWNALVSLVLASISVFVIGTLCLFCCVLYGLHALTLLLVLLPPGGRRPAIPDLRDMALCGALGGLVLLLLYPLTLVIGAGLDQQVVASLGASEPHTEQRSAGAIQLPETMVDLPLRAHAPSVGPAAAAVTVVELSDFQCSHCRRVWGSMATLEERYGDRVRFVFKHLPLDQACNPALPRQLHPRACAAAVASQCAHRQGRFWAYRDLLFQNQRHLDDDDLLAFARRLDLDPQAFSGCLGDPAVLAEIELDIADAQELGVTGTPRSYVAGREFRGAVSTAILDAGIRVALGEAEAATDGTVGTSSEVVVAEPLPAGAQPMVRVEAGDRSFWIDAVEASLDAQGRALSLAGATPANTSWFEASQACEAAGKRLCTAWEWLTACRGEPATDDDADGDYLGDYLEGNAYPYGAAYHQRRCNDHLDREAGRARPAGAFGACATPSGVFDLAGNLEEWAGAAGDDAVLLGGAFFAADRASCTQSMDIFGPALRNLHTGFRCCADHAVQSSVGGQPQSRVAAPLALGEQLPELEGLTPVGRPVSAHQLQGRPAVVAMWSSWCQPCQRELPVLQQLHERWGERGLEVLVMGVDRDPVRGRTLRAKGLSFPFLQDQQAHSMGQVGGLAMPLTLVLDAQGRLVLRLRGWNAEREEELRAAVKDLLVEP